MPKHAPCDFVRTTTHPSSTQAHPVRQAVPSHTRIQNDMHRRTRALVRPFSCVINHQTHVWAFAFVLTKHAACPRALPPPLSPTH
eukprot:6188181-Pleurochrysis_carterae.AAC.5